MRRPRLRRKPKPKPKPPEPYFAKFFRETLRMDIEEGRDCH